MQARTNFIDKIKHVAKDLQAANFVDTRRARKQIKQLEKDLTEAQSWEPTNDNLERQKFIKRAGRLKKEELMWRQRSRAVWLKEGDKNTNYFHRKAKQRQRKIAIKKIKNENNVLHYETNSINHVVSSFFEKFEAGDIEGVDLVCSKLKRKINDDD